MQKLSTVLEPMQATLTKQEPNLSTSSKPSHGSTAIAGTTTTPSSLPSKSQSRQETALQHSQNESLPSEKRERRLKLADCKKSRDQLTHLLMQSFAMLRKYGQTAEMQAYAEMGWQVQMSNYTLEEVTTAFHRYMKRGRDLPAPADIHDLIRFKNSPMPCREKYNEIMHRLHKTEKYVTDDEKEYCKTCREYWSE